MSRSRNAHSFRLQLYRRWKNGRLRRWRAAGRGAAPRGETAPPCLSSGAGPGGEHEEKDFAKKLALRTRHSVYARARERPLARCATVASAAACVACQACQARLTQADTTHTGARSGRYDMLVVRTPTYSFHLCGTIHCAAVLLSCATDWRHASPHKERAPESPCVSCRYVHRGL